MGLVVVGGVALMSGTDHGGVECGVVEAHLGEYAVLGCFNTDLWQRGRGLVSTLLSYGASRVDQVDGHVSQDLAPLSQILILIFQL